MIQPVKEKIILGIDPGTTIMGYGVLRVVGTKPEMVAMGVIDLRKLANHYSNGQCLLWFLSANTN